MASKESWSAIRFISDCDRIRTIRRTETAVRLVVAVACDELDATSWAEVALMLSPGPSVADWNAPWRLPPVTFGTVVSLNTK